MPESESLLTLEDGSVCHVFHCIKGGNPDERSSPILVLIHGAGHSLNSWTCFISESLGIFPEGTEFISYDIYGHGTSGSIQLYFNIYCTI